MKEALLAVAMLFFEPYASHSQAIRHASCEADGNLHVVYANGQTRSLPKEPLQVACDDVVLSKDAHTVGWSVMVENCCTSYPIARAVSVLHDGRKRVIAADQMVWQWRFVRDARELALLSGPVHGYASEARLYDLRSGRQLATWDGDGATPSWASGWEQDFDTTAHPDG